MAIPLQGRVYWCSTAASIPSADWERDTDFDNKFMQGSTSAGTNGGGGHTHTQSHTHTGVVHTHNMTGASTTPPYTTTRLSDPEDYTLMSAVTHSHNAVASNSATITYQNNTTSTDSADMLPPYMRAIILKPKDTGKEFPNDAVGFFDYPVLPSGFYITDGNNSTVNLSDSYLLGATTGADGGGTGGATTHTHTISDHTHSIDSHYHLEKTCGNSSSSVFVMTNALITTYPRAHHGVYLQPQSLSDLSTNAVTISSSSSEPAYKKLLGIQNKSGSASTPMGLILPFVGLSTEIPSGWTLCDGSETTQDLTAVQIKVTTSTSEIGNTGGSNSHTHSSTAHGHTHSGTHTHTETADIFETYPGDIGTDVTVPITSKIHGHTWTIGNTTPTLGNTTITTDSSDGRYNYRTVLFIKRYDRPTVWIKGVFIKGGYLK